MVIYGHLLNNSPGIPGYEGTQIADDSQTAPGKDFLDSSLCWKDGGRWWHLGNGHKFARPEPIEGPASVRLQWSSTLRSLRQDKINALGS